MGAETSAVIALIFIGLLIISTTTYASFANSNSQIENAKYEQDTMKKTKIKTDITIMNITNTTSQLNLTIKNTGKTTLNSSAMNIFVNGNLYGYSIITGGYLLPPQNLTNITIPVSVNIGDRIKITTENGVSDYRLR